VRIPGLTAIVETVLKLRGFFWMSCHAKRLELRPACWPCRMAWDGSKAGASRTHSKRFAHLVASLHLCAFAVDPHPRLCHLCNQWFKLLFLGNSERWKMTGKEDNVGFLATGSGVKQFHLLSRGCFVSRCYVWKRALVTC
jgi:hypothetical protein